MIWLYAITDRPDVPAPPGEGLAGAPVQTLAEGPLAAVLSRHDALPAGTSPDELWAHERVVERLMPGGAVLPMRFGTALRDERDVRDALWGRRQALSAALERVRGHVELGVRALPREPDEPVPPPAPDATGRAYLLAKLDQRGRAEAIHAPLARLATDSRRSRPRAGELLHAAYLVRSGDVDAFRHAVDTLACERQDVVLVCTGPWPPYAFAALEDACA